MRTFGTRGWAMATVEIGHGRHEASTSSVGAADHDHGNRLGIGVERHCALKAASSGVGARRLPSVAERVAAMTSTDTGARRRAVHDGSMTPTSAVAIAALRSLR